MLIFHPAFARASIRADIKAILLYRLFSYLSFTASATNKWLRDLMTFGGFLSAGNSGSFGRYYDRVRN
jgi:hypothetical protein